MVINEPTRIVDNYLKNDWLIIFAKVEGENVSVHERLSTLAKNVDGFLQELYLNPRHVVLLHVLHSIFDAGI